MADWLKTDPPQTRPDGAAGSRPVAGPSGTRLSASPTVPVGHSRRVCAGTIRSSKLDVQATGSTGRDVAALLPSLSSANSRWRMVR